MNFRNLSNFANFASFFSHIILFNSLLNSSSKYLLLYLQIHRLTFYKHYNITKKILNRHLLRLRSHFLTSNQFLSFLSLESWVSQKNVKENTFSRSALKSSNSVFEIFTNSNDHRFFYFFFIKKLAAKSFFGNSTLNSHSNLTMDNFLLTIAVLAVHHFITLVVNWQSTM